MTAKLTWPQAVAHMSGDEERLKQYLRGDNSSSHPVFDTFLPVADGMMRSRITSRYSTESYDAWTSDTIPTYIQFHLLSLLLAAATARDEARPDLIKEYEQNALGWLSNVESGRARIAELSEIASGASNSVGGSASRIGTGDQRDSVSLVERYRHRITRI
jgi:hypothetical protein